MYYELKLKVTRPNDKGEEKEVCEQYITDCTLFSEAEATGLKLYDGRADVVKIARSDVREIVNPTTKGATYYKATIVDIFVNDDGTEKELKYRVLVCAADIDRATKLVLDYMKQGLQDMRLDGVVKTKILDII